MSRSRTKILVSGLLVLAVACSRATTPPVEIVARPGFGERTLARIVVVSAESSPHGEEVAPDDLEMLAELVVDSLAATGRWDVESAPVKANGEAASLARRTGVAASAASADAGMAIEVSRVAHRVGSDFGVKKPASVAFRLLLVPAGETEAVWKADYAFTQEPLSQNLWNLWGVLRGGPKWMTARELAAIGIDEAIARLADATR